jgi:hypothetical protein
MKIEINKNKKIADIQQDFQKFFPFLKIEFYKQSHSIGEGSQKRDALIEETLLAHLLNENAEGVIHLNEIMKVGELENLFAEKFGLYVQLFRKSGKVWLQTTTTDTWTLKEQSKLASEQVESDNEPMPDSMDRQELE